MTTRELDGENLGHDEDWEGHCAAVTCTACRKVYVVTSAEYDFGPRECPNCHRSAAQCYGTRMGGGSASITWLTAGESPPRGVRAVLGLVCLILGSMGLILGITFSTILLVGQVLEGGFGGAGTAFVVLFFLGGCLVVAGVKLRQ